MSQGGEPRDRAVLINPLQEVEQSATPQQNNMARAFAQDIIGVDTAEVTYSAYFVKKDTKTSQGTSGESADYEGNRAVFSDSGDGGGAFEKFFQATDEDESTVTYTPRGIWVKQQKTDGGRVFEPATPAIIKPTKEQCKEIKVIILGRKLPKIHNEHHVLFYKSDWLSDSAAKKLRRHRSLIVPFDADVHRSLHENVHGVPLLRPHLANLSLSEFMQRHKNKDDYLVSIKHFMDTLTVTNREESLSARDRALGGATLKSIEAQIPFIERGLLFGGSIDYLNIMFCFPKLFGHKTQSLNGYVINHRSRLIYRLKP